MEYVEEYQKKERIRKAKLKAKQKKNKKEMLRKNDTNQTTI